MRLLLLNLTAESLLEANNALAGQGYDVSTEIGLTIDQVLALSPEVLVTEASATDLDCAGLISSLKSRPDLRPLKIVMIVPGGPTERAHALNLGADDAVSLPFDGTEFAARIRAQFRERQSELEVQTMLKYATQRENIADLAVESLNEDLVTKRRRWLLPAIFAVSAAAVIASVSMLVTTRRSRKDTLQLRAEIARLNYGIGQQQDDLMQRTRAMRESLEAQTKTSSATHDSLVAQSADLKKKMATAADASESASLKQQLSDTQSRLKALETEGKVAETVVHNYSPSVCLLHVVVEFLDKQSGKPIQIAVDGLGKPIVDDAGMVQLDSGGPGPHLQIDVFGTGFLVRKDGRIVTNHHVAEPWWNNDELKDLIDRGASAYVISYRAYFPGSVEGIAAKLDKISSDADVAVLRLEAPAPPKASLLELDDRHEATISGEPVVLIGYPTGIEGILARAGSDVAQKITTDTKSVTRIVSQLASEQLIRPTTTQGHIGDILRDKIVYDAATTSGGSGGPLFNRSGKVIGVNFAILKGFGGSNLAVPVRYANELLK
jgi:S1-C subfamily serine protease/DNA-binding NarL/FixJ family response regulator